MGMAHLARTDKVKLVQDDHTLLRVQNGEPVLHVAQDQQIQVDARDSRELCRAVVPIPLRIALWRRSGGCHSPGSGRRHADAAVSLSAH